MKLTLVGFIFMYEKVRIFVLNKSRFEKEIEHGEKDNACHFRTKS